LAAVGRGLALVPESARHAGIRLAAAGSIATGC